MFSDTKEVLLIDNNRMRSIEISHREIETQRESSFRGSIAMEASTSRYGEIRLIIAVAAAVVRKKQHNNSNNNMNRSDLAHACKALRSKAKVRDLVVERVLGPYTTSVTPYCY